ncbi:MAG: hypothetical protein AVDCRST_MAG68-5219, partial [uncultured Gemmatimonadetes bacterium]
PPTRPGRAPRRSSRGWTRPPRAAPPAPTAAAPPRVPAAPPRRALRSPPRR